MSIGFPTHTVLFIIGTMVAAGAAAWLSLLLGLRLLPIPQPSERTWLWVAGIVLTAWLATRLALAIFPPGAVLANQFLITFTSLGLGLSAGILLLLFSPVFRQIVRAIPEPWLVGTHSVRLGGFLFLALLDMKLLPAQFALSAGYGDVTAGLLALGLAYLLATRRPYARALVIGWNVFGLLDFVSALTTGGLYLVPFSAQVAASGMSLDYLNYVLIVPSFGVPLYALLHLGSLYQMLSRRPNETQMGEAEQVPLPVFVGEHSSAQR